MKIFDIDVTCGWGTDKVQANVVTWACVVFKLSSTSSGQEKN